MDTLETKCRTLSSYRPGGWMMMVGSSKVGGSVSRVPVCVAEPRGNSKRGISTLGGAMLLSLLVSGMLPVPVSPLDWRFFSRSSMSSTIFSPFSTPFLRSALTLWSSTPMLTLWVPSAFLVVLTVYQPRYQPTPIRARVAAAAKASAFFMVGLLFRDPAGLQCTPHAPREVIPHAEREEYTSRPRASSKAALGLARNPGQTHLPCRLRKTALDSPPAWGR